MKTADKEKLWDAYRQKKTQETREQLIIEYAQLVKLVAGRLSMYLGHNVEYDDLVSYGIFGLIDAIDKFDLNYDVKFSTYAVPMISGEIRRFLRDDGMIKVSRSLKETAYKAFLARERLQKKYNREPTMEELAAELEVEKEELAMALDASGEVESLHKPIYQKDGNEIQLLDKLEEEEGQEETILNHMLIRQLLEELDREERQLIYLRYFANQTQSEIGKKLGISQVQVSRLEKKILKNMRTKIQTG